MTDITYDVIHYYLLFKANESELRSAVEAIKTRRGDLARAVAYTAKVGNRVSFIGNRGIRIEGVVKKINRKNLTVSTDSGVWKVPFSMITIIN